MKSCLPFIHTEIDVVSPSVIIALGATACAGLGIEGPVGKNRGRVHQVRGFPVVVTYHPSYLLRQEQEGRGLEAKRQSWEDVLLAMATAQLPINEKQRNYFKPRL
jgi:DNA polymerase